MPVSEQALPGRFPNLMANVAKYRWRSHSAAFVMGPNGETTGGLRELALPEIAPRGPLKPRQHRNTPYSQAQSDIHDTTRSILDRTEIVGVLRICATRRHIIENPLSFRKVAFALAEDAQVAREAKNTSRVLSVDRRGLGMVLVKHSTAELTTKRSLQLVMALEAGAYIGIVLMGLERRSGASSPYVAI
ncbi:unnamed protein product [Tuber aestivum]|uniref:Uncharacterized protein n=1 Tax=Tuber aestivum TaxID=59557 RepID=A0A292Q170_9PEZI|nr:unnamed protein product [Tuber aestivum]